MTDPLHQLQAAAAASARVIAPGSVAGAVIVLDINRRKILEIAVPVAAHSMATAVTGEMTASPVGVDFPTPPPPPLPRPEVPIVPGWEFTPLGPKFDGRPIPLRGRPLQLLKVLAETEGPMTADQLRRAVWTDYKAEEATVRWAVGELRKSLRQHFPEIEEDTIVARGDGYYLTIR